MEPAAGGKGWFCVQKNCRADEEQTWPLSSRKRWELVFQEKKKKTKPETRYIIAAVKSDTAF